MGNIIYDLHYKTGASTTAAQNSIATIIVLPVNASSTDYKIVATNDKDYAYTPQDVLAFFGQYGTTDLPSVTFSLSSGGTAILSNEYGYLEPEEHFYNGTYRNCYNFVNFGTAKDVTAFPLYMFDGGVCRAKTLIHVSPYIITDGYGNGITKK
jgi:hypothetical protein